MERFAAAFTLSIALPVSAAHEVDFRLAGKHLVIVPVLVEGQGPYEFLLDTGSTISVVDRELARALGLTPLQHTVMRTASGTERAPIARLNRLQVGSQSTETVLVLCSELSSLRSLDAGIRGILGFNFLSRFRYLLDYKAKRLLFEPGQVEGARVPFDGRARSIVLTVDGLRLLLDTGASGLFLFDREGLDIEPDRRGVRRLTTSTGRRIAESGWIASLDIGGESFRRVPVTLVTQTGLEARADGLLPGTLFDAIYFDHGTNVVVLNPVLPREVALPMLP